MMLTDQKESLHEVCAQWHEKHNKGNANYQSVIMHHWMRSGNTPKKVGGFFVIVLEPRFRLCPVQAVAVAESTPVNFSGSARSGATKPRSNKHPTCMLQNRSVRSRNLFQPGETATPI